MHYTSKGAHMNKGGVFGLIIVILLIIGGISSCSGGSVPRAEIKDAVESALSTDLTDPADSKFAPDEDVTISKNSDGDYEVQGYVDAANAFGGHVRDQYKAIVTKMDGGSWKVDWALQNTITGQWDNGTNLE